MVARTRIQVRPSLTHSAGVVLWLRTLLHLSFSLGTVMAAVRLMLDCLAMSVSQVVLGLSLGIVPMGPIIR